MDTTSETYEQLIRSAARSLTGYKRRQYIAQVTNALCKGSARLAERRFGFSRKTTTLALHEARTGIRCVDAFCARGLVRREDRDAALAGAIRELADPHTQADPQLKSTLLYTRLTAKTLRQALITDQGYTAEQLPSERSLRRMLNRMGYRLKRIQKTKPERKLPQTDAIFANVARVHQEVQQSQGTTIEISIDTKAKVDVGEFCRDGKTRADKTGTTPAALDHDMTVKKR